MPITLQKKHLEGLQKPLTSHPPGSLSTGVGGMSVVHRVNPTKSDKPLIADMESQTMG